MSSGEKIHIKWKVLFFLWKLLSLKNYYFSQSNKLKPWKTIDLLIFQDNITSLVIPLKYGIKHHIILQTWAVVLLWNAPILSRTGSDSSISLPFPRGEYAWENIICHVGMAAYINFVTLSKAFSKVASSLMANSQFCKFQSSNFPSLS